MHDPAGHEAPQRLTIHSQRDERAHVVELAGELDSATVPAFEDELRRVEATDVPQIIVDLRGLTWIDSVGLKAFINAGSRSRRTGGRLTLLPGSDQVQRTFETTGLVTRLPFAGHSGDWSMTAR